MSPTTIYLVTGANRPRGIGLSLTAHILATHENAIVYAGARDPENAHDLQELKTKHSDRLVLVKYVSGDVENNAAVAKEIEKRHGRVDTVIANAGILKSMKEVTKTTANDLEEHFRVNVVGTVILFQAMYTALKKSANPRFIPISSGAGSVGGPFVELGLGSAAYATSKAALNWITRKIHFENEWLVTFPLSPGGVSTDMHDFTVASIASDKTGVLKEVLKFEAPTAAHVAVLLLKVIDESTREKDGGEFVHVDGSKLPW